MHDGTSKIVHCISDANVKRALRFFVQAIIDSVSPCVITICFLKITYCTLILLTKSIGYSSHSYTPEYTDLYAITIRYRQLGHDMLYIGSIAT